ncbi:hypothetical protein BD560DRAFT_428636 [Blakeslea trispora]|nr:hypothetical protein BD560DRAFT_428636 [Blakeslea trispora]
MLPSILYAYRTKAHSILKLSPYELLFGIEPLGKIKMYYNNFMPDYNVSDQVTPDVSEINIGDPVLMLKHNRRNKLEPKYRDRIYTVLAKKTNNVYILSNDKGIRLKRAVNGSQIRRYYARNNSATYRRQIHQ